MLNLSISIQTQHQHGHCKKTFLCIYTFFLICKNRAFCPVPLNIPSCPQLFGVSITLLLLLISMQFPIHTTRSVHSSSKKRSFKFSEAPVHQCLENRCSVNSGRLLFRVAFCRGTVNVWHCKKGLHSRYYPRNFLEF